MIQTRLTYQLITNIHLIPEQHITTYPELKKKNMRNFIKTDFVENIGISNSFVKFNKEMRICYDSFKDPKDQC